MKTPVLQRSSLENKTTRCSKPREPRNLNELHTCSQREKPSPLEGETPYENCFEFPKIHGRDARYFYHSDCKLFSLVGPLLRGFIKTNESRASETAGITVQQSSNSANVSARLHFSISDSCKVPLHPWNNEVIQNATRGTPSLQNQTK